MMNEISEENSIKSEKLMAPMSNKSIVDRIITRITDAIISGELLPGQKIPTENELCDSMQVGRNSVREAVKSLVAMGVLNIRRAEGTFVAEGISDRMLKPMIYGMILEGGNTNYMIELRRMLEVGVLNLAVQKATDKDIEQVQNEYENLKSIVESNAGIEEILDADIRFHKSLEKTIRNPLVEKISEVVEQVSRPTRAKATEHFIQNKETDKLTEMHQQIVSVLMNRDESAVATVIDAHYEYWKDELK